jgi:hypothetical protein
MPSNDEYHSDVVDSKDEVDPTQCHNFSERSIAKRRLEVPPQSLSPMRYARYTTVASIHFYHPDYQHVEIEEPCIEQYV